MTVLSGVLAVLLQTVLTVPAVPAVPTDGTQPAAATGFGSVAPRWLGTRVLTDDPATGYGKVQPTPPPAADLAWVRLAFWGFDGQRHTGELGPVVRAFARIGWEWGGAWRYSKDYMHFSQNGL